MRRYPQAASVEIDLHLFRPRFGRIPPADQSIRSRSTVPLAVRGGDLASLALPLPIDLKVVQMGQPWCRMHRTAPI
jgi:hypothetical protein